jgi:hypothetical protein
MVEFWNSIGNGERKQPEEQHSYNEMYTTYETTTAFQNVYTEQGEPSSTGTEPDSNNINESSTSILSTATSPRDPIATSKGAVPVVSFGREHDLTIPLAGDNALTREEQHIASAPPPPPERSTARHNVSQLKYDEQMQAAILLSRCNEMELNILLDNCIIALQSNSWESERALDALLSDIQQKQDTEEEENRCKVLLVKHHEETKQNRPSTEISTVPPPSTRSTSKKVIMTALLRIVNHGYSLSWFKHRIFPYLGLNIKDTIELRTFCKLFRDALDPPLWTIFPHPNYSTLSELVEKLNSLHAEDPQKAPTVVFVREGTFYDTQQCNMLFINYPLSMIGAGQNKTFLNGYSFVIQGTKEEGKRVVLEGMTVTGNFNRGRPDVNGSGVIASGGLSFLCDSMTFTQCPGYGVYATNQTKGRLKNCVITQCRKGGIAVGGGRHDDYTLIELEGSRTKADGNGYYGLYVRSDNSAILLLTPLTKEAVATNNNGCHQQPNYHSNGSIQMVDTFESFWNDRKRRNHNKRRRREEAARKGLQ